MLEKPSLPFFDQQFSLLTGHEAYRWQRGLFQEFIAGRVTASLNLPTGAGKTNVITCWLLALVWQKLQATVTLARRLVWVVNRRKVVDQTSDLAERIADTIEKLPADHDLRRALDSMSLTGGIGVSTLRGEHEDNQEWSDDPSAPAIIVGTVDMVGSRLLLSGYGLSPRQRAQDAALLANDVLLVNDEAQISPAFARLIRLIEDARSKAEVPLLKPFVTMHVSATLDESSLARGVFPFDPAEETSEHFWKVYTAKKTLRFREVEKKAVLDTIIAEATKPSELLRRIVFVRQPKDVKFIARAIAKKTKSKVLTVTGTMRGFEREQLVNDPMFRQFLSDAPALTEPAWLVCTSAAEVGIDISSDLLVMDMDTAEHLTQRLGRVNRFGEVAAAVAVLVHEKNTAVSELSDAERNTLDYLHSLPQQDGGADVSCKTIFENPAPAEAQGNRPAVATFTERDLALLSYTSVRHSATKPDVDALLHGAEASPAYVELAWREELPQLLAMSEEEREEWLSSHRVLAHERLRELNYEVSRILGQSHGTALLVESDGTIQEIRIPDELTVVDKKGKPHSALPRESLLILAPGLAGLSSGMLAEEENGNDVSGTADRFRFIAEGDTIRGEGREFSDEEFKAFLRQNKLFVKLRAGSEELGIFTQPPYSTLVPQVTVEQTDGIKNLLEIGHRLADAVVRYSDANPTIHTAFAKARAGDFTALAKLNPTALILGVWDSRDTRVKVPRAFSSQIDAFGIRGIRDRAAQFVSSATEATKAIAGVTDDEEASTKKSSDKRSAEGFNDIPSFEEQRGGIIADEIVRTSIISMPLVRRGDAALQNYLFGLALVMFTYPMGGDLRSGTLLVSDANRPMKVEVVYRNGKRESIDITHEDALEFAQEAAAAFGVGENKTFTLNESTYQAAQKVLDGKAEKSGKKGKK